MKGFMIKNKNVFVFTAMIMLFVVGVSLTQLTIDNLSKSEEIPVAFVEQEMNDGILVSDLVENVKSPVDSNIAIVGRFYDLKLSDEELASALVYFEGVYRTSYGITYCNDGNDFDVYASVSGTITKKTDDPLLGWVITLSTEDGVDITYQSLGEVNVEKGEIVKQGDTIGVSGQNIYQSDLNSHLHFIIEVNDVAINPENVIGKSLNELS